MGIRTYLAFFVKIVHHQEEDQRKDSREDGVAKDKAQYYRSGGRNSFRFSCHCCCVVRRVTSKKQQMVLPFFVRQERTTKSNEIPEIANGN